MLIWLRTLLGLLHILMWRISPARSIIEKDMKRWVELGSKRVEFSDCPDWKQFICLVWRIPTFRNLLYYRIRQEDHWPSRLILEIAKRIYPRWPDLWIVNRSIGPGLYIQHGFSTAIGGKSIGANCWINQQVTIGNARNGDGGPTIGDNVRIAAGAKVLGDITIGDNCIIAANSFVCKSIPPNCTVVGVPAYIIRRDGKIVRPRSAKRRT